MADTSRPMAQPEDRLLPGDWTVAAAAQLATEILSLDEQDLRRFIHYLTGYSPVTTNAALKTWRAYWESHKERYGDMP